MGSRHRPCNTLDFAAACSQAAASPALPQQTWLPLLVSLEHLHTPGDAPSVAAGPAVASFVSRRAASHCVSASGHAWLPGMTWEQAPAMQLVPPARGTASTHTRINMLFLARPNLSTRNTTMHVQAAVAQYPPSLTPTAHLSRCPSDKCLLQRYRLAIRARRVPWLTANALLGVAGAATHCPSTCMHSSSSSSSSAHRVGIHMRGMHDGPPLLCGELPMNATRSSCAFNV